MMRSQWTIGVALSAATALFLVTGLFLPAMLLFPVPIAYFRLTEKNMAAYGLLLCATLVPTLVTGSVEVGIIFGITAAHGLLLGVMAQKRVSLGIAIAALTLAAFVFLAVYSAANWDAINADWQTALQVQSEKFESTEDESAGERYEAIKEWLGWVGKNLAYLYYGALFSFVLLMMAAVSILLYGMLPALELFSMTNRRFIHMRTPEHLVWLAILLAGLWFWDNRLPNDVVRFISWNGALALATVYWLNGASIVFYISHAWKWRPIWTWLLLLGMVVFNVISMLSIVGFFDTWIDFRRKALRMRPTRSPDNKETPDT